MLNSASRQPTWAQGLPVLLLNFFPGSPRLFHATFPPSLLHSGSDIHCSLIDLQTSLACTLLFSHRVFSSNKILSRLILYWCIWTNTVYYYELTESPVWCVLIMVIILTDPQVVLWFDECLFCRLTPKFL